MDPKPFRELGMTISGLVQPILSTGPLRVEAAEQDGTWIDEAVSMLRAEGCTWMHLD